VRKDEAWWTSQDIDGAYIPAEYAEVLEAVYEVSPFVP
jgi:hypothetical protein